MHSTSLIRHNSRASTCHHSPVVGTKGHRGSVRPNRGSISIVITPKSLYRARAVYAINSKASEQELSSYFIQHYQHQSRVGIVCDVLHWPLTAKAGICASRLTPTVQSRHPQRAVRVKGSSITMNGATEGKRRAVFQNSDGLELVGTMRDVGEEVCQCPASLLKSSYICQHIA
jgi:hypothetical protein